MYIPYVCLFFGRFWADILSFLVTLRAFWPRFCPRRGRHWVMGGCTVMLCMLENDPDNFPLHICPQTVSIMHHVWTLKRYGSKADQKKMAVTGPNRVLRPKKSKTLKNMWKLGTFGISLSKPCICGQIWMKWHQMSFLAHFWLFLAQFGHSGSPAWAHMTAPFGFTHTNNTYKCPRHFHRQKKA